MILSTVHAMLSNTRASWCRVNPSTGRASPCVRPYPVGKHQVTLVAGWGEIMEGYQHKGKVLHGRSIHHTQTQGRPGHRHTHIRIPHITHCLNQILQQLLILYPTTTIKSYSSIHAHPQRFLSSIDTQAVWQVGSPSPSFHMQTQVTVLVVASEEGGPSRRGAESAMCAPSRVVGL